MLVYDMQVPTHLTTVILNIERPTQTINTVETYALEMSVAAS